MEGRSCTGHGARILIVDDNVALAENVAEILELDGYRTAVAASAEDALPLALADDLSVLVTDFRLPGMNGAELVRRVCRERCGLRCIVISAFTDEHTMSSARDAGARFLSKPLSLVELSHLIRDMEGAA